jgi:hypothetical protein
MAKGKARPWQPTTVRRFVKAIRSSACTALVVTDAGLGYLKALGGPEGPHTLACDWIGTHLARWLGLPTFDCAIIEVTEQDEIPFHTGSSAQPGPAFITRAESGETWSGRQRQLRRLINPQDVSRLVVFDTWTLNCDRHGPRAKGKMGRPRVNRNNVFLSEEAPEGHLMLKAMDHTHCFSCGRELTTRLREIDTIKDPRIFGLFPEFRPLLDRGQILQAAKDLRTLDKGVVVRIVQDIPREWSVPREAMNALVDLVVGRAAYVAEAIVDSLWPQRELFDDPDNAEQSS